MSRTVSISKFIRAIRQLPSDEPRVWPRAWYQTQKEHWLGWLGEYHGPGAYGRTTGIKRDAVYAYNHIVNHNMLLWLIKAAGVRSDLVDAAKRAARRGKTMQAKSAAIRRHVGWEVIEARLWGSERNAGKTKSPVQRRPAETLVMNIEREHFAAILSGRKPIEYRELKDYWLRRLDRVSPAPFNLRLLNGMLPPVPEAVIRVTKVIQNRKTNEIELHLGRVLRVKHWDRAKEKPSR